MRAVVRPHEDLPEAIVRALRTSRAAGAVTGAGVSAESGIGTYRGRGGLYDDEAEGDRTVQALTGSTFRTDPDRTWRVLAALARAAAGAAPNPAHHAFAELERRFEHFVLLTQNVDGLHRRAGSRNLIEIHGHLFDLRCTGCAAARALTPEELSGLDAAPRCAACGAVLRPEVVLFEEMLPGRALARLEHELLEQVPDLLLVAGTTALFPYVAAPAYAAAEAGKLVVEVNPEETAISPLASFRLEGPAGLWLPRLVAVARAATDP